VDHHLITQASVVRFIEDNWLQGARVGGGSFDAAAGSLADLFDFGRKVPVPALYLDPQTGEVLRKPPAATPN
jgi:phospholipase C